GRCAAALVHALPEPRPPYRIQAVVGPTRVLRERSIENAAIQVKETITAAQNPSTTIALVDPDATPANASRKKTPVSTENPVHRLRRSLAKRRACTKQAAMRHRKPTAATAMWRTPCRLRASGRPAGVPAGKPFIGSATKTPAATRPRP